jgi:hypothetical protein
MNEPAKIDKCSVRNALIQNYSNEEISKLVQQLGAGSEFQKKEQKRIRESANKAQRYQNKIN